MAEQNMNQINTDNQNDDHMDVVDDVDDLAQGDTSDGAVSPTAVLWASDKLFTVVCLVAGFWLLRKVTFAARRRLLPYISYLNSKNEFVKIEEVKKDHFSSLGSIVSYDPELRKQNVIKILEIGVGAGVNFHHYPWGCRLTAVDPNPHFKNFYDANRKRFPNIHSEDVIATTGDKMDMIPDNSVDVVVATLVMCSVDNVDRILREILRVLAPGGKYYFMEHTPEFDLEKHGLRRKLQDVFTWLGVFNFIFDGCVLNRDILPNIERAGFSSVDVQKYYSRISSFLFYLQSPNIKGIAVK